MNIKNKYSSAVSLISIAISLFLFSCSTRTKEDDRIPPGNIKDLRVVSVDYFGAELEFTAPGDDIFSGKAFKFDVRYSDDTNFLNSPEKYFEQLGIPALEVPDPPYAGQKVKIFIKNLDPKTKYYVGIRTYDESENFSDVSNIVEFTTRDIPGSSGEVIGKISSSFLNLSSDGKKIYLMFPGLYSLEEIGGSFKINPISTNIPPIHGARVIWDGEKFISIGGNISGNLVQSPIAVYPNGNLVIMENSGDIVPFGPNGFFGYGVMSHKIVKLGNWFAIIGGVKFFEPRVDVAIEEGKISKIGLEKIALFRVEGNKVIWSLIYPQATTYPFSSLDPAIINIDGKNIVVWGGNLSENSLVPSSKMTKLEFPLDSTNLDILSLKPTWKDYTPFSGSFPKLYNTCESQTNIKIFKIKFLNEVPEGAKNFEEIGIPTKGETFIYQGRPAIVSDEIFLTRTFVIGVIREAAEEFSRIFAIFSDGKREIFSKVVPVIGKQEFKFPDIGGQCYAEYVGDKLFILHLNDIYIIKFNNYDIITTEE